MQLLYDYGIQIVVMEVGYSAIFPSISYDGIQTIAVSSLNTSSGVYLSSALCRTVVKGKLIGTSATDTPCIAHRVIRHQR